MLLNQTGMAWSHESAYVTNIPHGWHFIEVLFGNCNNAKFCFILVSHFFEGSVKPVWLLTRNKEMWPIYLIILLTYLCELQNKT